MKLMPANAKLSASLIDDIAQLIRAGNFRRSAAKICGVSEDTLHAWIARGRQIEAGLIKMGPCPKCGSYGDDLCISKNYKTLNKPHTDRPLPNDTEFDELCLRLLRTLVRADEEAKARAVIAWNRSIDSGDWRAAKDFLARRWPEEWGQETIHMTHTVIDRKALEDKILGLLNPDSDDID
jgi:hypothetical protein